MEGKRNHLTITMTSNNQNNNNNNNNNPDREKVTTKKTPKRDRRVGCFGSKERQDRRGCG